MYKYERLAIAFAALAPLSCHGVPEPSEALPTGASGSGPASTTPSSTPAAVAGATAAAPVGSAATTWKVALPAPGYQRFEATPVELEPSSSSNWAQWVGGPLDQDYDVLDIRGEQMGGGHHAIMYSTIIAQPAGHTRPWADDDLLTARLMGGHGGEGGATIKLPEGVVFRVKKGSYLLMQTHYINVTERATTGRSYLDVKMVPKDASHRVASLFSNGGTSLTLPPLQPFEQDLTCTTKAPLNFLQISNHMHAYGVSSYTEFTPPSGAAQMLRNDPVWEEHFALNPVLKTYPVDAPQVIPSGSVIHTHCKWNNTTGVPVVFPAEMCVFFAFMLNDTDVTCNNGKWIGPDSTAVNKSPAAGAGAPMAGTGGAPATSVAAMPCSSAADQAAKAGPAWEDTAIACTTPCAFDPDIAGCARPCLESVAKLSPGCASCTSMLVDCNTKNCAGACAADSKSTACRTCVTAKCGALEAMCR